MTPLRLLAVVLAAAALFTPSCRTAPRRPNVVLVTLDTLRPDRLGCYGGTVATPNLDRVAREGVVWESAITQAPLTAPSHASMFTGLNPMAHKVRDTGGFVLDSAYTTLAEIMQARGWDTAAFVGSAVLKKGFGLSQGFGVYDDEMPKADAAAAVEFPERRAAEVVDRAVKWLDGRAGKPFFLWLHLFDPHSPYDPPSPFREQYAGRPYDGEVAYTDQQLGRVLDAIRQKAPRDTVVAVLSDHGESLSEHGEYTHGVFLYDSTIRIAFLMSGPGLPAAVRSARLARAIDVMPTLLDLVGLKPPEGIHGKSLVAALSGKDAGPGEAYSETLFTRLNMGWVELRALRTSKWKYVAAPKPELYDLAQDPHESANVVDRHPGEARELATRLRTLAGTESVKSTMVSPKTMEQLKSLGYLGGASQQQVSLTGQGIDPKDRTEVLKLLYVAASPDAGTPASKRLSALLKALALDPSNPTIYHHLGSEYKASGKVREAVELYRDGIEHGVRTGWLYSRLASLYVKLGRREEAIDAFERAAQLNPSDCDSLSDLAQAYLDSGRPLDAERALKWSVASGDEHAATQNGLGLVAVRKGDADTARAHFEKAVQLDPDLLEAQLNLGRIYRMMGANTRARLCFERFLAKASPSEYGPLIPQIREELKALP
jgi:arylsulfatase A-like enzyme/Tfp pilus assembly protein PilF